MIPFTIWGYGRDVHCTAPPPPHRLWVEKNLPWARGLFSSFFCLLTYWLVLLIEIFFFFPCINEYKKLLFTYLQTLFTSRIIIFSLLTHFLFNKLDKQNNFVKANDMVKWYKLYIYTIHTHFTGLRRDVTLTAFELDKKWTKFNNLEPQKN